MLLRYSLSLEEEADAVESAVDATLAAGCRTADLGGGEGSLSTEAMGDRVISELRG